jgi:uncharacterized protein involved in outer membrane biogenesis
LIVTWQRDPDVRGWHGWLPGPHVSAANVTIGNTDWAKSRTFATFKAVELSLDLTPLLTYTLSVPSVHLIAPNANLERLADGRDNWTFAANDTASPWRLDLGRIQFDQGDVAIIDRKNGLDAKVHVDALRKSIAFDDLVAEQEKSSQQEAAARIGASGARRLAQNNKPSESPQQSDEATRFYAFGLTIDGTFKNAPVHGSGKIGGALALKRVDRPFPIHADVRIGDTRIAFVGTLVDPTNLDALDLRLWLSGKNLADLYDILKVNLPNSPAYATEGHLTGRFTRGDKKLRYQNFVAHVGGSDFRGDLLYESKTPRPLLSGKVQSDLLQFRDLAPLIGANPASEEQGKVLPEEPFRTQRWQGMDANVQFTGDRVFRDSELPIHKVDTRIVMDNALLTLDPLRFNFAYGDVESSLRFDGRSAPIKGSLKLTARGMQLERLIPKADSTQVSLGRANGEAMLEAQGNSVAALLGAANGELKLVLDDGTLSKAFIETIGLNVPNILAAKLFGDQQVTINCAVADFVATAGVYDSRLFVIDTDIAAIEVSGQINLANEQLDLIVHPNSKGVRLLSLRSPIHVQGTFKQLQTSIDKRALLTRGIGAAALGAIAAPIAALLPLTASNLGKNDDNRCTALLRQMQAPPAAKNSRK